MVQSHARTRPLRHRGALIRAALVATLAAAAALAAVPVSATTPAAPASSAAVPTQAPGDGPVGFAVNEEVGRIERAYLTVLGRRADVDGLTYWLDLFQAGMSYDAIVDEFLASPERVKRFGPSVSDSQFLDNLYLDALGRPADPDGKAYWLGILQRVSPGPGGEGVRRLTRAARADRASAVTSRSTSSTSTTPTRI